MGTLVVTFWGILSVLANATESWVLPKATNELRFVFFVSCSLHSLKNIDKLELTVTIFNTTIYIHQ